MRPSVHVRNVENIVNWLAFPCFVGSEIFYKREVAAINACQFFAVARGRFIAIVVGKIFTNILSVPVVILATVINLAAIPVFKLIACCSKYSQDKQDLNARARETWRMTGEYWTHGIPLLFGRIFSCLPMSQELIISSKLNANLRILGYAV